MVPTRRLPAELQRGAHSPSPVSVPLSQNVSPGSRSLDWGESFRSEIDYTFIKPHLYVRP